VKKPDVIVTEKSEAEIKKERESEDIYKAVNIIKAANGVISIDTLL
jgi:hypothetical protein